MSLRWECHVYYQALQDPESSITPVFESMCDNYGTSQGKQKLELEHK